MKLLRMEKTGNGKYLNHYVLTYENKAGREKKYEIVSRRQLIDSADLGRHVSGISIIAFQEGKLLLLHEFRMGVNQSIYNLCAGMIEEGESAEDCIRRELYEETGLSVKRILDILPPSFSAPAISDVKTYIAFVEVSGRIEDHSSDNEWIEAGFYTREEVASLLSTEPFSSRAQLAAYFFQKGLIG